MASDLFSKFCTYCQDDIPGIRVKCVDCQDFDLCLQCFSAGAEIGPHKNDHSYQFVDSGSLELFRSKSGWSAREELQLLNCVERYGFGNWEAIAQHIKTRTADEVRDEYMNRYLDGSLGRATWPEAMKCRARLANLLGKEEPSVPAQSPAHLPPLDVTPEEASQLGYMPHRDDFEREYDNEAESLVTSLNISGEDDELDIALKLAQVDMYIQRLRERTRRKRVCQDYQLVSQYFASRRERPSRKKSTAEQELEEKLFGLCQFQTVQEHDGLLKSIVRQKELQRRLQELLRYRKNGLTMLEEMSHFEQERQSRESVDGSGSFSVHSQTTKSSSVTKKREKNAEEEPCSTTRSSTCHTDSRTSSPRHAPELEPQLQPQPHPLPSVLQQYALREPAHLLSHKESQLCASLDLTPSQFISMKTLLLTNPVEDGENMSAVERRIMDHITASGWTLSPTPQS